MTDNTHGKSTAVHTELVGKKFPPLPADASIKEYKSRGYLLMFIVVFSIVMLGVLGCISLWYLL